MSDLRTAIENELNHQMRPVAAPESLWAGIEGERRRTGPAVRPRRTIAMGIALVPCAALMLTVVFSGNLRPRDPVQTREWVRTSNAVTLAGAQDARCASCHIQ